MKYQDLFSLKNKKKLECLLLQILLCTFRVSETAHVMLFHFDLWYFLIFVDETYFITC